MAERVAKGDRASSVFARSATAAVLALFALSVSNSARADWWSENVELHGKASSTTYFNSPSFSGDFKMDQWWNQMELDTDIKLFDDEVNALSLHTIIMPTYDAVYDVYPHSFGDRRQAASPGTQSALLAKDAMTGDKFKGAGFCIKGGFCDVNQDTGSLFTGKNNPAMVIDDTIFFGILVGATRSRNASLQGKLGGGSSKDAWQEAARIRTADGLAPAFLASLALSSRGATAPIHSFNNASAGYRGYVIGDRRSIEEQFPVGINLTDGQLKTHCFDTAHPYCWGREFYFEAKMGDTHIRVGRQQIVWGKTDAFRLQDIVNPIDFSYHNVYPSLEDRRIPTLSADLVQSFGNVGGLEDVSLELVWVFDKFTPVYVGQCGDFWAFTAACEARADVGAHGLLNVSAAKVEDRKWTFRNTEPGFRFEFRTPEPSISFSLSGFWGIQDAPVARFDNPYSTHNPNPAMMLFLQSLGVPASVIPAFDPYNPASIQAASDNALNTWKFVYGAGGVLCNSTTQPPNAHARCIVRNSDAQTGPPQATGWIWSSSQAVVEYPRTFTLGGSADYQIPNIDTVLRMEAAYDFNREIQNTKKLDGIDHSNVVLAAIGLDRSFFIPFVNKDRTAFLSFQTFMEHVMNFDGNQTVGMATYEWSVISTFFMQNYWRGDSIVLTNFFAYDWAAHAWITGPSLKWILNESLFFEVGVNLLEGSKRVHNIRDICSNGTTSCLGDPATWQAGNWQLINKNFARNAEGPYWNLESFADSQMSHRDELWFGATYQF